MQQKFNIYLLKIDIIPKQNTLLSRGKFFMRKLISKIVTVVQLISRILILAISNFDADFCTKMEIIEKWNAFSRDKTGNNELF